MHQRDVDPAIICRKHLIAEHAEIHMLVGTIETKKQLDGFATGNCLDISKLKHRHDVLVEEMLKRSYNHYSPLPQERIDELDLSYLPDWVVETTIDPDVSLFQLLNCKDCCDNYSREENSND